MIIAIDTILAQAGDPRRARLDWERFAKAHRRTLGRDPDAGAAPQLVRLFGNSHVLSNRLIAHPHWWGEIAASPSARRRKPVGEIARELAALIRDGGAGDAAFDRALRTFKYRELARLVALDLEGAIETEAMLAEWSDVAGTLIAAAYAKSLASLEQRLGPPRGPDGSPVNGAIIALGKLGSAELNISSDVDLLVLYGSDEGGACAPDGTAVTLHEFYVRLASEITQLLAASTADGFVFRVDHELRPEGHQGPLANAVDAALRYYESFGSGWERQALIRARPVAGDFALGRQFLSELTPFVYRRSISIGDLAHLREMKERMEEQAAARGGAFDIKLGQGGIREAEFLVQALQSLHGGAHPAVRTPSTGEAIAALRRERLVHPASAKLLRDSYAFLRRVENMIQAENDLQTHRLPADEAGMAALARRMGDRDGAPADAARRLSEEMARHTHAVAGLFRALFEADYERLELEEAIEENLARAEGEEEAADSLAWFRRSESRRLAALDLEGGIALPELLRRLSLVAEVVVACAWRMARRRLVEKHGEPRLEDGGPAALAVVGMGRLGSREVDYGSDLDLIFLSSGDGQTDGARPITNIEFFTKLAQRILALVSLWTRYGRAYLVDSELRPSGGQGTLVATLEAFSKYHLASAQVWERLSLLRARPIAGADPFRREVQRTIEGLAYRPPPPDAEIRAEIDRLRRRALEERALEGERHQDIKIGRGGLAELEAVIGRAHLRSAPAHRPLWRQNTFEVLSALAAEGIVGGEEIERWRDHLLFFRRLLSRLRLLSGSALDAVDLGSPLAGALAVDLGFADAAELGQEIGRRRHDVHRIYEREILQK